MDYMEMRIKIDEPIGYMEHKPTRTRINVYHSIGWFRRLMLRLCFGLEYNKIK